MRFVWVNTRMIVERPRVTVSSSFWGMSLRGSASAQIKSIPCLKRQRMKLTQGMTGIHRIQILVLGRMLVEKGTIV